MYRLIPPMHAVLNVPSYFSKGLVFLSSAVAAWRFSDKGFANFPAVPSEVNCVAGNELKAAAQIIPHEGIKNGYRLQIVAGINATVCPIKRSYIAFIAPITEAVVSANVTGSCHHSSP